MSSPDLAGITQNSVALFYCLLSIFSKWALDKYLKRIAEALVDTPLESDHIRYHVGGMLCRIFVLHGVNTLLLSFGLRGYALDASTTVALLQFDAAVIVYSSLARRRQY